jgi:glycine cleavage system aminomethyltransferase T
MMSTTTLIARSPLAEWHARAGATLVIADGWQIATHYPAGPAKNMLVDRSYLATFEINGPGTGGELTNLCGADVPLRSIHTDAGRDVYRLTPTRSIIVGGPAIESALDVTGGWATISLSGKDAERILNKVTAVDLRERTLPVGGCCQGPIFGVNTLFGRFADRFDLHVCTDSAEFFWEVLLDAGAEFGLRPAGTEDVR